MLMALLASGLLLTQQAPPPPPLMWPYRPPPVSEGLAYGGMLGSACDDTKGSDGRWFNDHEHPMSAGLPVGLNLSSSDFAPVLQIIDPLGAVVATARGETGQPSVFMVFTPPGEAIDGIRPSVTYRLRTTTIGSNETGAWRLEVMADGRTDTVFPGERSPFPVRTGCQPLPPIDIKPGDARGDLGSS